ncbi:MAG TPA: hypothetical protein VMX17_12115 [Candidatus Glassbacteria bacterium]|nr:hypothetical protein [Candidatus Glassbacteria bacterium]
MINEIRYEIFQKDVDYSLPSVFLAGPTVRGNQPHLISWRFEAIEQFRKQDFSGKDRFNRNYDAPIYTTLEKTVKVSIEKVNKQLKEAE